MPPGAIGSWQLERGGPLPGYFQPCEIKAPAGTHISWVDQYEFSDPQTSPLKVGLLIGATYRFRVTGIPVRVGQEVYPTIELLDRLYPPPGQAQNFPIPIELTEEELHLALEGRFVTRVIYLEDPDRALPIAQDPESSSWFEVRPGVNPLAEADRLGRPVAILRMGGRLPDRQYGLDESFFHGSPPLLVSPSPAPAVEMSQFAPIVQPASASMTSANRVSR